MKKEEEIQRVKPSLENSKIKHYFSSYKNGLTSAQYYKKYFSKFKH
ncbi:hypothetical protein [Enterococcus aquimarinus]|nr:hypothetical protein [Enterococcus aquimarinus]